MGKAEGEQPRCQGWFFDMGERERRKAYTLKAKAKPWVRSVFAKAPTLQGKDLK